MAGKLYGIGVGPGDPELLTLKAVRTIRKCDLILVPGKEVQDSVAFRIAVQAVPELAEKEIRAVVMPMTRNRECLRQHHDRAVTDIIGWLEQGKVIGFLNLGDITIYSTYLYMHQKVTAAGYQTGMINGVPSFCAAAAALNVGLSTGSEPIHILPEAEQVEEGIRLPGTKVIMKMGSHLNEVKHYLTKTGNNAGMVENCGMPGEKIYKTTAEIPENAGYFSVVIVKEQL